MNLSPANKLSLLFGSYYITLFIPLKQIFVRSKSPKIGYFASSKLRNTLLASFSLINLDFLLPQTVQSDVAILFPLCFYNFGVFTVSIFSALQTIRQDCLIYIFKLYLSFEFLISSFTSSYSFRTLFTEKVHHTY